MQARARHWVQAGLVILLLAGLFALAVYATYHGYTTRNPGANDFYSRWVGGCALLREGLNPYSDAVTLRIQQSMYGRPARPGEDQVAFAYPLYSLFYFWPLCYVQPYALVQAIWMWLLLAALLAAILVWAATIRWRPALWLRALTLVWAIVLYHSFRAVVLGQLAVLVLLALVGALWAMRRGRDGLAGVLLALATVKPQMVYLAIPWLLVWAAGQRRWRLWWGFGASMAILALASFVLVPSWLPDFIHQSLAYPSYTLYGSLTWMIVEYWLGLGPAVQIGVQVLLAGGALTLAWRLRRGAWEQMLWMLGLLLLLTNFFTTRIATTNYLLLLPWAIWAFQWMQRTWGWRGILAILTFQAASVVGLWALFLATIEGNMETAPVYYPLPLAMIAILAWLGGRVVKPAPHPSNGKTRVPLT